MVVVLHCRRLVTVHVVVSVVDVAGMASFADAGTSRLMTSGKVMLATMVDDDSSYCLFGLVAVNCMYYIFIRWCAGVCTLCVYVCIHQE